MKSAWTNLLIGMADPSQNIGTLMNNLVDSVMAVADNLVPRIAETLPRVVTGLSQLAQKLAPYIPPLIEQLLPSLIQGATSLLSDPNNISKTLNNDQREITRKTVSKYIGYLENAFLFYEAKRYDLKGKKYLENNSKFYLCDPAFRYAVNGTRNMDFGRVYENIVYLELRRRGYEVYVGKLYKKEVDFVAKKRDTLIYIQVSDNISDETTFEREYSPLLAIRDAYPKMVIARHHKTYDYQGVQVVDICRWLRCDTDR